MLFPSKKQDWKQTEEYSGVRVFGIGERNRNGSDRQLIITGCKPGMKVTLRHDPDHATEKSAVAVIVVGGQQIGILDPAIGEEVAPYLASDDVRFTTKIARVGPMEDEHGRRLAGVELELTREDYTSVDRFALLGFVPPLARFVFGPFSQAIDQKLITLTKGDRFGLLVARCIAIFLGVFLAVVVVLTLFSIVRGLITRVL
jgi:hypothetical protein